MHLGTKCVLNAKQRPGYSFNKMKPAKWFTYVRHKWRQRKWLRVDDTPEVVKRKTSIRQTLRRWKVMSVFRTGSYKSAHHEALVCMEQAAEWYDEAWVQEDPDLWQEIDDTCADIRYQIVDRLISRK